MPSSDHKKNIRSSKLSFAVYLMVSCSVYRAKLLVVDYQPEPDVRALHRPRTCGCGDRGHVQVYSPLQVVLTANNLAIYIIL